MSTADLSTPIVITRDGLITVTDMNLDHDRLYEAAADWNHKQSKADEDWDARRVVALEESAPVALAAADEFRNMAGLTLSVGMAVKLIEELTKAVYDAERQRPVRLANPMLREA